MRPSMRFAVGFIVCGSGLVEAAINLEGGHVVGPLAEDDPSPISDPTQYIPDQHDCPLPCMDYANPHSWITYFTVERLQRCREPMLLRFSTVEPLDNQATTVVIRACTLTSTPDAGVNSTIGQPMENPKRAAALFRSSLDTSLACKATGSETEYSLEFAMASLRDAEQTLLQVDKLLEGMRTFFAEKDNCDENLLFAYYQETVASVYLGERLGKQTVEAALKALTGRMTTNSVAQLCGSGRPAEQVFGISFDGKSNLAAAQMKALEWSKGNCAPTSELQKARDSNLRVKVFEIAGFNATGIFSNGTALSNDTSTLSRLWRRGGTLSKRATCRYIQVVANDDCGKLLKRCGQGLSAADFYSYNKKDLCSQLFPDDYVCCSAGDPYTPPKPDSPKPNADGTCATHLIKRGDTCSKLAKQYGVTVKDLEKWNKGKTWAWNKCEGMKVDYNMCVSNGGAPMPPPQAGTICGPLVPGTKPPAQGTSLADLNPCPLKACCSNWGFCGVFPGHCDVHAPNGTDAGPGATDPGVRDTCVSNCGQEIKKNSGPPAVFSRIGYYESFGMDRECLWLTAKNANTDGSYTHIHWGFAEIDPNGWKVVIKDTKKQWSDFKALNVKRIISFGGWAYSTEAVTFNIIRDAIINNRETFTDSLVKFVKDEGIDGVDIDWEYPGAPDILVNGQPIGQKGDGIAYLKFLTVLKQKMPAGKSVSIAAPASFWYLQAFPIDRIAAVIDYIVYMTYDLHGQWDANNPNSFDSCPSGYCIRSHVNLTETRNTLAMITKAGVPNNKIFVGEASYGRSFHMAQDGCWGPTCAFTGTRTESDANPGRCTKTGGYLAQAEINEILRFGGGDIRAFHDGASNTDVMLYKGDYVSYMTPTTKETRRGDWKGLNFAGTVDWAVDLQGFSDEEINQLPERPSNGKGCNEGYDTMMDTGSLCEFSCTYGFCPEPWCTCSGTGTLPQLPAEAQGNTENIVSYEEDDIGRNRLCKFACKYGYCPEDTCTTYEAEAAFYDDGWGDDDGSTFDGTFSDGHHGGDDEWNCLIFKDKTYETTAAAMQHCKTMCKPEIDAAEKEGRTTNYGCLGWFPLDQPIPWNRAVGDGGKLSTSGRCMCDNGLVNIIADTVIEALPAIAQIGCFIVMSTFKLVLDIGTLVIPGGGGRALDGAMQMMAQVAQLINWAYPKDQNPLGALEWWLAPCGDLSFVPQELRNIFDILSSIPESLSGFKPPSKIGRGSGRVGDQSNPTATDRAAKGKSGGGKSGGGGGSGSGSGSGKNTGKGGSGKGSGKGNGVGKGRPAKKQGAKTPCRLPKDPMYKRLGEAKNTLRMDHCVGKAKARTDYILDSMTWRNNAPATLINAHCPPSAGQACYHYSSAIRNHPTWKTLTCPPEAATRAHRTNAHAVASWTSQHSGYWTQPAHHQGGVAACQKDEYPPAYLLTNRDDAFIYGGMDSDKDPLNRGQSIRWLSNIENSNGGRMWKGACLASQVSDGSKGSPMKMDDTEFLRRVKQNKGGHTTPHKNKPNFDLSYVHFHDMPEHPEFTIGSWFQSANPLPDDGLWDNKCWPRDITRRDPGFCLLKHDPWYKANEKNPLVHRYDYEADYVQGINGD